MHIHAASVTLYWYCVALVAPVLHGRLTVRPAAASGAELVNRRAYVTSADACAFPIGFIGMLYH
jgi:hypothetical protein